MPDLKFVWERIKQKKLAQSIIFLMLLLVWIPTFTPDDAVVIPAIIGFLGLKAYLTIALILLSITLIYFNGRLGKIKSLMSKPDKLESKNVCRSIYSKESDISACIKRNAKRSITKQEKQKIKDRFFLIPLILISVGVIDIILGVLKVKFPLNTISSGVIITLVGIVSTIGVYYLFDVR